MRMRWVTLRSVVYVTWRDYRYRGFHFAMRRLCGSRFGRFA